MKLALNTVTIENTYKRSVLPSFVESRIKAYNGKKVGKKRAMTPQLIEKYRELDGLIRIPFKLETGKNSRFNMNDKVISTPLRGGNHIRYFTTDKEGQLTKVSDRGIIWYLCALTCQANKKEDHHFGVYGAEHQPTIDHCIAQTTLDRWYLKGIIEKDQIQYIGNYLLMRDSKNSSKNNRSEYLRVDRYFTAEQVAQAKKLLDLWFEGTQLKRARITSKNRKGEEVQVKATCYAKLVLWYQIHQLCQTEFYKSTISDLNPRNYPFAMVAKYHPKEHSKVFYV